MSEPITMQGEYQTRDGREVTLKFTDGRGQFPVAGYIDGIDQLFTWTARGQHISEMQDQCADLIPKPKRHTVHLNCYQDDGISAYGTRREADKWAIPGRIACVCVTYTEGEGLEPKP